MIEINKIYNEDCLVGMSKIPDGAVDMILTSPPYDNLRTYNNTSTWNFDIYKNIANQIYRVIKPGGVVVWIVADATINGSETGTSFKQALFFMELGFNLHDTMIWVKPDPVPLNHNRYEQSFEYMFIFSKGKPVSFNPIKTNTISNGKVTNTKYYSYKDIKQAMKPKDKLVYRNEYRLIHNNWNISVNDGNIVPHPAKFPIKLVTNHIYSWSTTNDIILDPFMGSGTTAIACIRSGRQFIGFETDKQYYETSLKRIENELSKQRLNFGE